MGYYCGPAPGTSKEMADRFEAERDALVAEWAAECDQRRAAQSR